MTTGTDLSLLFLYYSPFFFQECFDYVQFLYLCTPIYTDRKIYFVDRYIFNRSNRAAIFIYRELVILLEK